MDIFNYEEKPLLHSRLTVFLFTFFAGAFFGGLLYIQNLFAVGKRKLTGTVILLSIIYNYFTLQLFTAIGIHNTFIRLFLGNVIAAFILCWWAWINISKMSPDTITAILFGQYSLCWLSTDFLLG